MLVLIRLLVSIASLESTEFVVSPESIRRLERIRRQRVWQKEHAFLLGSEHSDYWSFQVGRCAWEWEAACMLDFATYTSNVGVMF